MNVIKLKEEAKKIEAELLANILKSKGNQYRIASVKMLNYHYDLLENMNNDSLVKAIVLLDNKIILSNNDSKIYRVNKSILSYYKEELSDRLSKKEEEENDDQSKLEVMSIDIIHSELFLETRGSFCSIKNDCGGCGYGCTFEATLSNNDKVPFIMNR